LIKNDEIMNGVKMQPSMKLAPSILNSDFSNLRAEVAKLEKGGAHWLHLDVMDGHFVPNLTVGPMVCASLSKVTHLPIDCHLMVENPEFLVPLFAEAGASHITVQVETTKHLDRLIQQIKSCGCTAGVTLNPATPIESLAPVLGLVDMVLIMTINPGFGGQKLIPYCLDKVRWVRERYPMLDIQVDGGVKEDNIKEVMAAGASNFVVGSAIFQSGDAEASCRNFISLLNG
jgi:ribulose-phosphate 3-epimerase